MLTVSDSVATSNPDVVNIYVGSLVPEATAPPAPTSLSSNPSDSTVVLNWQTPDDGGSVITDYVIEYKSANSSWSTYDDGVSSNTISIISDLENNISYQFRISAVNSVGTSDSSSLISATPISSAPIVETPIVETPITPEPTLGIASFVDTSKDPQSYVDRYNNEPTYKEWFDENYSQYLSIYEAVGLEELSVGQTLEPEYIPEPIAKVTSTPNCGAGIEYVNGFCKVIQTQETSEGGGCLIATATYGSEMLNEVQQLRELRDNQLLNTESGTAFMGMFNDIYYSFSPIIADYERENPLFKEAVKLAITPMISTLSLMENANSESEVLGIGISVIALNLGMYLGVPAIVVIGIRKRF
jgi:titin